MWQTAQQRMQTVQQILLLEDFQDTREWLTTLLGQAFPQAQVTAVATLKEGFNQARAQRFDLALLDLNLPDGNGLELAKFFRAEHPATYLVISTIYDDDDHVFQALQIGVQGYLLKEQPKQALIAKLQGIAKGEPPLTPTIARKILRYFQHPQRQPEPEPAKEYHLTPREEEVLTLVAKGLSRKEIARLLDITPHTASGYIKSIYQKLNISSRTEATIEASRMGLIRI